MEENKKINVESFDICLICFKDFKIGDEVISLCLYDEIIEKGSKTTFFDVGVKEAYQLASYHKKCSPIKLELPN